MKKQVSHLFSFSIEMSQFDKLYYYFRKHELEGKNKKQ